MEIIYSTVQDSIDELYARAGYTGEKYKEDILHGADPVLGEGMIPVYLAENGDVYYANEHTSWYSYEYKRWANAVILVDNAYNKYSVGQKISEEDIESYFVWIPRYAYKLWDLGQYSTVIESTNLVNQKFENSIANVANNSRIIDIKFGTLDYLNKQGYKKQTRDLNTGLVSDPAGIKIGDYLIHPGFTLGEKELNGIWVGKFEAGGTLESIKIKPNILSLHGIKIALDFNASYEYERSLDSHMLKNTEWGAITYLSLSVYGIGTKTNFNNNSDYKTGYSSAPNTI